MHWTMPFISAFRRPSLVKSRAPEISARVQAQVNAAKWNVNELLPDFATARIKLSPDIRKRIAEPERSVCCSASTFVDDLSDAI